MKTTAASRRGVRTGNAYDGGVTTQRHDTASGRVMKTTVASGHSVRTGNEDDGRVRTQCQDA
jgi:hypothetical protein